MLVRMLGAVVGVLLLVGALFGFEAQAVIRTVDAENGVLVVFGGNQEHTARVDKDAKFFDEQGQALADGLQAKELKAGAVVTLIVEREGNGPAIKRLQLGGKAAGNGQPAAGPAMTPKTSVDLKPLSEMTAADRYKNEDGGLYGGGQNVPPSAHRAAAKSETAKIVPLDADGKPSPSGTIGLVSISMSNATQEFSEFKRVADADPQKSSMVTIIDCAQGGQAMAQWVDPAARPWAEADRRLQAARVSPQQVQVAWIKLANVRPTGELPDHGGKLQKDTAAVARNAKARFPNLRIAYLGSRIYGGYASTPLNPEPYAYEGAFAVRWLIQDQIKGNPELNYDAERGAVKAPLLLWGPYFWADGMTPRKSDGLIWERGDLAQDGTHPSRTGQQKVANQLLTFFKTDEDARGWFVRK